MPIIRAPRPERDFTVIANRVINDPRLSWAARGMLAHLLSKPDHWSVNVQALINETQGSTRGSGRDAVYRTLEELDEAGYIVRKRNADGSVVTTVYEEPVTENPDEAQKPNPENPDEACPQGLQASNNPHTGNPDMGVEPHPEKPDREKPDRENPDVLVNTEYKERTEVVENTESGDLLSNLLPTVAIAPQRTASRVPNCPYEHIRAIYHEEMPGNPVCKVLDDARKAKVRARWEQAARLTCKPFGYSTLEDGLAAWRAFFATCNDSDFLTGKVDPPPDKKRFFADLTWLVGAENFAKCLENKYHERERPAGARSQREIENARTNERVMKMLYGSDGWLDRSSPDPTTIDME